MMPPPVMFVDLEPHLDPLLSIYGYQKHYSYHRSQHVTNFALKNTGAPSAEMIINPPHLDDFTLRDSTHVGIQRKPQQAPKKVPFWCPQHAQSKPAVHGEQMIYY